MSSDIRQANEDDIPLLLSLETSFPANRQFNKTTIKRSLKSPNQDVFVIQSNQTAVGSITIWRYQKTWRIYNIAILPDYRKHDFGRQLMRFIISRAKQANISQIALEVDSKLIGLINWYKSFGFVNVAKLKDYYGYRQHAYKLILVLKEDRYQKKYYTNVIVSDIDYPWLNKVQGDDIEIISAETFLNDEAYITPKELRIFNLCSSYDYQSVGYYVSLIANARGLRTTPNVATIEDFYEEAIASSIGDEIEKLIEKTLKKRRDKSFKMTNVFNNTYPRQYSKLGKALSRLFDAPIIEYTFVKDRHWHIKNIRPLYLNDLKETPQLINSIEQYLENKRFSYSGIKQYKYDLAILIDPKEEAAPSGKTSLKKFVEAAGKLGFYAEFITKEDYHRLPQYDALFIRVTTNVNDYTYQFSRYAYAEGLVVIDDPWSILKCANKVYFHEAARAENIKTPQTLIISSKTNLDEIINTIGFPIILKRPDSASSQGVYKVNDKAALKTKLKELFKVSQLLIAQECIISPYDWRIGILGGQPIYACKYYMAKDHWQIYNWNAGGGRVTVGKVDTLLIEDAPKDVVASATKAASLMGDGFYGVDIKIANSIPYVIEVNDCPSVDYGWEDKLLGDKLYLMIIEYFLNKIEQARQKKTAFSIFK